MGQHAHAPPAGVILSHILHLKHLCSKQRGCGVCGVFRTVSAGNGASGGLQTGKVRSAGVCLCQVRETPGSEAFQESPRAAAAAGTAQLSPDVGTAHLCSDAGGAGWVGAKVRQQHSQVERAQEEPLAVCRAEGARAAGGRCKAAVRAEARPGGRARRGCKAGKAQAIMQAIIQTDHPPSD